jgi:hypothetical protein
MLQVGDKIKVVGLGAMFVGLVEGSSGEGEVLHYAVEGEILATSDFAEKAQYQEFFPEQYSNGIFYRDGGTQQALWIAVEDYELIEETPEA